MLSQVCENCAAAQKLTHVDHAAFPEAGLGGVHTQRAALRVLGRRTMGAEKKKVCLGAAGSRIGYEQPGLAAADGVACASAAAAAR